MGSAYSTIAADVAARYQRLKKQKVIFITGTDEHGEKIAAAAADKGVSPQQHCDAVAAQFQSLWAKVGDFKFANCAIYLFQAQATAEACMVEPNVREDS